MSSVNGYKYSYEESKTRAFKALQMSGRTLDLTHPSKDFKWVRYSKELLDLWEKSDVNYQEMVRMEVDLIQYAHEELVEYVNFYVIGVPK